MTLESTSHLSILQHAVQNSVAALTAVKIDTVANARDIIRGLLEQIKNRPHKIIEFSTKTGNEANHLLKQAIEQTRTWPARTGVLSDVPDKTKLF